MAREKRVHFDCSFRADADPGKDATKWPENLKDALMSAVHHIRDKYAVGKLIAIDTYVENKPSLAFIGFPYVIHVSAVYEKPNLN